MENIKVVVDRKWWLRGDNRDSCLLHPQTGKMCCMGFWCLAKGFVPSEFISVEVVSEVMCQSEGDPEYVDPYTELYRFNDNPTLSDTRREELIIEEGKRVGIDFSFEN